MHLKPRLARDLYLLAALAFGGCAADGAGGPGPDGAHYTCTTASLFAGDPVYANPMERPSDGTPLLADPPLPFRTVVFKDGQLITHDGQEIWRADLSDGRLHRIAGVESTAQALITGPCGSARFANIFSIGLAADGSLLVSDQTGNAILKVSDPLGPTCTVSHYAGTPDDIAPGDVDPDHPANVGNVDGPGATAKFALPERMAIDASDNVYVWDQGNDAIRKIAPDASHTVSTIASHIGGGGGSLLSQVVLGGTLYVYGNASTDVFLTAIDLSTMATHDLFRGRADLFGGDSSDAHTIGGITTDGTGLVLFFNGQLFYVTTAGAISAPLAGVYGPGLDFSADYDPKASHPADALEIPTAAGLTATTGAEGWLTMDRDGALYVTSANKDAYVEKVGCATR
jgi:hypothetical protein